MEQDEPLLNLHHATLPETLHYAKHNAFHFIAPCYNESSSLLVADSSGALSAWDTRLNACSMTWQADTCELTAIAAAGHNIVTGSVKGSLKKWSISSAEPGSSSFASLDLAPLAAQAR